MNVTIDEKLITETKEDIVYIPLTQGQLAIVDSALAFIINQHKWYAQYDSHTKSFYAKCSGQTSNDKTQKMHRLIYKLCNGAIPDGMVIDHINGNTLDNRIENLRCVTVRQNNQNTYKHRDGKLVGCYWNKNAKKWMARIKFNGVAYYLGIYTTEQAAHKAYEKALNDYVLHNKLPEKGI